MKRDKSSLPTIAEAGPIGARKTRAVASGYREKVSKIQKGKTAKHEQAVRQVTELNQAQSREHLLQLQELESTIDRIVRSLAKPGLNEDIKDALEEQMADCLRQQHELQNSEIIPLALPEKENRILPNKAELLESAEKEAISHEATAGELADMVYERASEFDSASGLAVNSARAIDELYLRHGREGKGIDQLLLEQYVSHSEELSDPIKKILKAHLDSAVKKIIDTELTKVSDLGAATLDALRTVLTKKYQSPEKMKEVIAAVIADPEKSILSGYIIKEEIADLLLKEAAAQGAEPKDLAIAMKLTDNLVRDHLGFGGFSDIGNSTIPIMEAIHFFTQDSRGSDPQPYQFPINNPETKAVLEKVLGRELWGADRRHHDENFRDRLLKFSILINNQAQTMVRGAESRKAAKEGYGRDQIAVQEAVKKCRESVETTLATKLTSGREMIENGLVDVAVTRERTLQMEHRQNVLFEELADLKASLETVTPAEFLNSELADKIKAFLEKLNADLATGNLNDRYYRSLTERMQTVFDTGAWGVDPIATTVKGYVEDARGKLDLTALNLAYEEQGQLRELKWKSPDFGNLLRETERSIYAGQILYSTDLEKLFKGRGLAKMEGIKNESVDLRKKAVEFLNELGNSHQGQQKKFDDELRASAKPFQTQLGDLLKLKLEVARTAYRRVDEFDHDFSKLRAEKFSPIWEKLRAERRELDVEMSRLDREFWALTKKVENFDQSGWSAFSGLGAGKADRKALAKATKDRADVVTKIGVNRAAEVELENVFEAMNPIHDQLRQIKNKIFPPKAR